MVFGVGYDKSLSIILSNDDKKRKIILDFIGSFPKELYDDLISKIKNDVRHNYYNEKLVKGIVYFYLIDNSDRCITVGKYMKKDSYNNSIFLLKLYYFDEVNDFDDSLLLGNVIYQYKEPDENNINICDSVEYGLEKRFSGINFTKVYGYKLLFNRVCKKISIDDILSFEKLVSLEQEKSYKIRKLFNKFVIKK